MNIQQSLVEAQEILKEAGIDSYKLDAETLLFELLNIDKAGYYKDPKRELSSTEQQDFHNLLKKRVKREPVAKIIGKKEFYSLEFLTSQATLDPRPDTETLIDTARKHLNNENKLDILELGTGTGCIIITLLKYFKVSRGTSVDISTEALNIAHQNAKKHQLLERLTLLESNMFEKVDSEYDLIISNPPYIDKAEILELEPEVKDYDPILALDGGTDGLDFYREIAQTSKIYLKENGLVILEIGCTQQKSVTEIFKKEGFFLEESKHDLAGLARCLVFKQKA